MPSIHVSVIRCSLENADVFNALLYWDNRNFTCFNWLNHISWHTSVSWVSCSEFEVIQEGLYKWKTILQNLYNCYIEQILIAGNLHEVQFHCIKSKQDLYVNVISGIFRLFLHTDNVTTLLLSLFIIKLSKILIWRFQVSDRKFLWYAVLWALVL